MDMKKLKDEFNKNGINYTILERTDSRYFAELKSMESGNIVGYETGRILSGKHFQATEESEYIVGNEMFGRDKYEGSYCKKNKDLAYKDFLNGSQADKEKCEGIVIE